MQEIGLISSSENNHLKASSARFFFQSPECFIPDFCPDLLSKCVSVAIVATDLILVELMAGDNS